MLIASTLLALFAAIIPVTPPAQNFPCDSVWRAITWTNDTGQTAYVKTITINHQAAAGMIADIHLTVFHIWDVPGGTAARVVLIAPWDRYTAEPKPPASVDFGEDRYEVRAGDRLSFQSACTVLGWAVSAWHLPQPQFWYTREP